MPTDRDAARPRGEAVRPDAEAERPYVLSPLKIGRIDVALNEPRFVVTLKGQGRNFIIAPKVVDVIAQLARGGTLEDAARALSEKWGQTVGADDLRLVIEQQLIPRGIARPAGAAEEAREAAPVNTRPRFHERLLAGQFHWPLVGGETVGKLCGPLTVLYEPASAVLAAALVVASRFVLYNSVERHFSWQMLTEFAPAEYLVSFGLLVTLVLFHEFGHAAAQLRFGLRAGLIGFQLQRYIPAFYADVSRSWALPPRRRMVVDVGGVYFQSVAASVLYLLYLRTGYQPLLATVLASDLLSLIALIPFLKFDGYWLLADALAVPNLHSLSKQMRAYYWRRLLRRGEDAGATVPPLNGARGAAVAAYGVVKNIFWILAAAFILSRVPLIYFVSAAVLTKFAAQSAEGARSFDALLLFSSLIRLALFALLLLATTAMVAGLALKVWQATRACAGRVLARRWPRAALRGAP